MGILKKIFATIVWILAIIVLTSVGVLAWVFYNPKARCPKCGRKMKKPQDEGFGIWICNNCKQQIEYGTAVW